MRRLLPPADRYIRQNGFYAVFLFALKISLHFGKTIDFSKDMVYNEEKENDVYIKTNTYYESSTSKR